ncbi:MAG: hypothetical protein IT379_22530, partial [Deltaproteobacteria bacterium]|nr:hypothetical protein [Deltaproteobacteria bacterium]
MVIPEDGMVGFVKDTAGRAVAGGRVVLVPSADVARLSEQSMDLSMSPTDAAEFPYDEPIEDLLDAAESDAYTQAEIDEQGFYRIETLPRGSHFIVYQPAPEDTSHLPGGPHARSALLAETLAGTRLDLEVSCNPGPAAHYVGSSVCLTCHGRYTLTRTAHFTGLSVPGRRSTLQDTGAWPDFDAAIGRFEAGATLYFHDCRPDASGTVRCSISEEEPAAPAVVSFEVDLVHDSAVRPGSPAEYLVVLRNRRGAGEATYPLELTYGGALHRQQMMVPVRYGSTTSRQMLPMQFNHRGDTGHPSPADWPWRDV